jgi:hypothetical protein
MEITVDIPDAEFRTLAAKAAAEGSTVAALLLRGVDVVLEARLSGSGRRLQLPIVKSRKPGSLKLDNKKIYDLIGCP